MTPPKDGDGIAVYGGLTRSEGKSTVCAGFGTGKTNAVRLPLAFGDLALDIASVGLLNAPIQEQVPAAEATGALSATEGSAMRALAASVPNIRRRITDIVLMK